MEQWSESSQKESLTILIPQTTCMPMELTSLASQGSTLESIIQQLSMSPSGCPGKNSLMSDSPHIAPLVPAQDSEMTPQEPPSVLSEALFPKRRRVLRVSHETILQTQDVVAKYLLQVGDMIHTALITNS